MQAGTGLGSKAGEASALPSQSGNTLQPNPVLGAGSAPGEAWMAAQRVAQLEAANAAASSFPASGVSEAQGSAGAFNAGEYNAGSGASFGSSGAATDQVDRATGFGDSLPTHKFGSVAPPLTGQAETTGASVLPPQTETAGFGSAGAEPQLTATQQAPLATNSEVKPTPPQSMPLEQKQTEESQQSESQSRHTQSSVQTQLPPVPPPRTERPPVPATYGNRSTSRWVAEQPRNAPESEADSRSGDFQSVPQAQPELVVVPILETVTAGFVVMMTEPAGFEGDRAAGYRQIPVEGPESSMPSVGGSSFGEQQAGAAAFGEQQSFGGTGAQSSYSASGVGDQQTGVQPAYYAGLGEPKPEASAGMPVGSLPSQSQSQSQSGAGGQEGFSGNYGAWSEAPLESKAGERGSKATYNAPGPQTGFPQ